MDYLCYLLKVIKTYHFNPSQINVMSIIRLITHIRLALCYSCSTVYVLHKPEHACSVSITEMFRNVFEEKNIASALLGNVMKHKAKRIEIQDHKYDFKVT